MIMVEWPSQNQDLTLGFHNLSSIRVLFVVMGSIYFKYLSLTSKYPKYSLKNVEIHKM